MGFLDTMANLFKPKSTKSTETFFRMFSGYTPVFTSREGGLYEQAQVRAAINVFANNCAKLKPEIRGEKQKHLESILQVAPNPIMDTFKFLYRLATILMVDNNAFILPLEGERGELVGFFPIRPRMCELVADKQGTLYLRFTFSDGKRGAIELERVGVMNRFQLSDDMFGESNRALQSTLDLLHTQEEGIQKGIKNSAVIRYMAKVNNVLDPKVIQKERDNWAKMNLSDANQSGLLLTDNKFSDIQQVDYKPWIVDSEQMKLINQNINMYYGVNNNMLMSEYSPEEFDAFYASVIEPFAIQGSLVLTRMVFTNEEIASGSAVSLTPKRFDQMHNRIKLQMATQLFDRGIFSTNNIMDMYNLPHIEDGDRRYIRKEYIDLTMLYELNKLNIDTNEAKAKAKGEKQ